jgi:hypothetical protein
MDILKLECVRTYTRVKRNYSVAVEGNNSQYVSYVVLVLKTSLIQTRL